MTDIITSLTGILIIFFVLEVYRYRFRRQTTKQILININKKNTKTKKKSV